MPIAERSDIPEELPPARLFLDDIEEIAEIFMQAADPAKLEGKACKVKFRVGNFECDTVEELKELGTKTNDFGLIAACGESRVALLRLRGYGSYWTYGAGLRREDAFKVYGRLHAIFHERTIRWRAILRSIPAWAMFLFILTVLVPAIVAQKKELFFARRKSGSRQRSDRLGPWIVHSVQGQGRALRR